MAKLTGFPALYQAVFGVVERAPDSFELDDSQKAAIFEILGSLDSAGVYKTRIKKKRSQVLSMRFGLGGDPAMTQKSIAAHFGLTATRIQQIEYRGLRMLRHPSRSVRLREILDPATRAKLDL